MSVILILSYSLKHQHLNVKSPDVVVLSGGLHAGTTSLPGAATSWSPLSPVIMLNYDKLISCWL